MKDEKEASATNGLKANRGKKDEQSSEEQAGEPKTLDDIFRKTNATPFIYWLPLSQEQVAENMRAEEKRRAEKEARLAAQQQASVKSEDKTEEVGRKPKVRQQQTKNNNNKQPINKFSIKVYSKPSFLNLFII